MPRDLKQKLDELSKAIFTLSEEENPEDVLVSVSNYINSLRSNPSVKIYIESRFSTAPVAFFELLYHKSYSKAVHEIVSEWEADQRAMKPRTPASGYQSLIEWMQGQFLEYEEKPDNRLCVHVNKEHEFYYERRPMDILYKPERGLPVKIVDILYKNFGNKPLTAGAIAKQINSKKGLIASDIVSAIREINTSFIKNSEQNKKIIFSNHGYFINDRHFDIKLD